ncbi:hypothetical protein ABNG14_47825 (plasmid) [Streptomyces rapamycinicus]
MPGVGAARRGGGPAPAHLGEQVVQARSAGPVRAAQSAAEVRRAEAEAQGEPAAAELIDERAFIGQPPRVVAAGEEHAGAEPQRGEGGEVGQGDQSRGQMERLRGAVVALAHPHRCHPGGDGVVQQGLCGGELVGQRPGGP